MKKKMLFASLAVCGLLAAACGKMIPGGEDVTVPGDVELSVRFDASATKVSTQSVTSESAIQNVQIFVFRAGKGADAGNLEIAASAGFDQALGVTGGSYNGMTLRCSTGQREVWAVVNDSEDRTKGSVTTKSEFLALTHELQRSSSQKLLMIGHSGTDAAPAVMLHEGKEDISISVHRLVASVILESVKNDFSSPAYQKAGMFRLDNCYLINVPGRINFGETSEPSSLPAEQWYARQAAETTSPKADLIFDSLSGKILDYGATPYTVPHTFYTYPNNCAVSEDAAWCARATLLVLEASIKYASGWVKYYYPVQLSERPLLSNTQYRVNLTIHRPGSLDPNQPVTFDDVTPVISVTNWDTGVNYDREI